MSDTNEYLKILEERLKKLKDNVNDENEETNNEDINNGFDMDKTQILPRIDELSEYHNNSREVEKWKEKKYNDSIENSPIEENDLIENTSIEDNFIIDSNEDEKIESQVLLKEKVDEDFNKENDELLNRLQNKDKDYFYNKKRKRTEVNNNQPTKKWKKVLKIIFIICFVLAWLGAIGLFLFFKTGLFQYHKELYVETAMTTMHHKYLATWFLSADEINKIMKDLEVVNDEDSVLHAVELPVATEEKKENVIKIDKISGDNYVGHVMTISDPSKVKLVDSRKRGIGTKLSEICKNNDAIAGINAGGFVDPDGHGDGDQLCEPTFINQELLFGDEDERASWIGFTKEGELVLGKYTFKEAVDIGIQSALQFGPYIIVNGNNQITRSNQGGLHPRMAIGQKRDGTIIFVCIDGRQPGYSIGTTLLELQNIFERYGAYNAANLDGGSSATMYYDGKVINRTSTPIGERYLPNAIIVEK